MASTTCEVCNRLVLLVPYVPEGEIGLRPQYLRQHRKDGRVFAGPFCPGSGRYVSAVAERSAELTVDEPVQS